MNKRLIGNVVGRNHFGNPRLKRIFILMLPFLFGDFFFSSARAASTFFPAPPRKAENIIKPQKAKFRKPEPPPNLAPCIQELLPIRAKNIKATEADFLGDGEIETAVSYEVEDEVYADDVISHVIVVRQEANQKPRIIWSDKEQEIQWIDLQSSPLDTQNPKRYFLILHCFYGPIAGYTRVFKWEGKAFSEIQIGGDMWPILKVRQMPDGRYVIPNVVGMDADEGPDLYRYEKGFLIPCNYLYPEYYQKKIDETLSEFNRADLEPPFKLQAGNRGIMRFFYGRKIKEGIALYNKMVKLNESINQEHNEKNVLMFNAVLFRSYAYLEMGQVRAGKEELWKIFLDHRASKAKYYSCLGDFYYYKNDFKAALKYLLYANRYSKIPTAGKRLSNRKHLPTVLEKKIKVLKELVKAE